MCTILPSATTATGWVGNTGTLKRVVTSSDWPGAGGTRPGSSFRAVSCEQEIITPERERLAILHLRQLPSARSIEMSADTSTRCWLRRLCRAAMGLTRTLLANAVSRCVAFPIDDFRTGV